MTLVAERPVPGAPRAYRFPSYERVRVDNGLTIIVCPVPGRPIAAAHLLLEAGAFNEAPALAGVAALAARSLTEGTEKRGATDFAEAAERLGADIDARAGWETIAAGARVPAGRLEPTLELLAEAVLQPVFPATEVERLRSERLAEIQQEHAEPSSRAAKELHARIYTPSSPYARDADGTAETVAALGRDAVEEHYRRFATPGSATLVVAGDVATGAVVSLAERLFGGWTAAEPDRPRAAVEEAVSSTAVTLLDRPGSVQSNIAIGHLGISRNHPEYPGLQLMNYALGGSFTSRINNRLREEKGYTYGSRSSFDPRREPGPFAVYAPVETSVTTPAVTEILDVVGGVRDGGLAQDEIDAARAFLGSVFALRFETPDAIAAGIGELVVHGLPHDYFDTFGPSLDGVTPDDIARLARAHLRPDRSAVIVVGDASVIGDPLRAAGIGPVEVVADQPASG